MDISTALVACAILFSAQGVTSSKNSFPDLSSLDGTFQTQSQSQSQSQSQTQIDFTCENDCINGKCTSQDTCTCLKGWSGPTCEEFECTESCHHGHCVGPDTCKCNTGYEGKLCKNPSCEEQCQNGGKCTAPNTCSCPAGYNGTTCESAVCQKGCANGGTCVSPNVCLCEFGFEGTLCQIPIQKQCKFPFEYNGEIYSTCTTVDSEDGSAWCSPTTVYEGNRVTCDFSKLCNYPGQYMEIVGDCNHYYECKSDGVEKKSCEKGKVFNVVSGGCDAPENTPQCPYQCSKECKNGGRCIAEETCECPVGFRGKYCGIAEQEVPTLAHSSNVCGLWNGDKVYTFDGATYRSGGKCQYTLVSDCNGGSFEVSVQWGANGRPQVKVSGGDNYVKLGSDGAFFNGDAITIPFNKQGLHIFKIPFTAYTVISLPEAGGAVTWDGQDTFIFKLLDDKWAGNVCGMCGDYNGNAVDDFVPKGGDAPTYDTQQLVDSWKVVKAGEEECVTDAATDYCAALTSDQLQSVTEVCSDVVQAANFGDCEIPPAKLSEMCITSLCECTSGDYKACICDAATQFSRLCVATGAPLAEWRTKQFCEATCPEGMEHKECGDACHRTCRNKDANLNCASECVDGCFCPEGTVLDGDKCVPETECSCRHKGRTYSTGHKRSSECEECTCDAGSWTCKSLPCHGECSAIGDPHYKTFDGLTFAYSGQCQYVLSTDACGDDAANYTFAITAENVKCGAGDGVCTKAATLLLRNGAASVTYKLKEGGVVSAAGSDVQLPYSHGGVDIEQRSNMMIALTVTNGIEIEWDGEMRLYVRLAPAWKSRVCGLCGNFNQKVLDDMRTPQMVAAASHNAFGNSWKAKSSCVDVPIDAPAAPVGCSDNQDKKDYAEEACGVLKSPLFQACHTEVDYTV